MNEIYTKILEAIPDYAEFLTVDEMDASSKALAAEYPDVVSISSIGNSRDGNPLYCLKIGNGSKKGMMYGLPHPNEPIGAMMLEYFARAYAESEELRNTMDYTFYIIKCWDVDGTKLNEKWFKGPFTIYNYARNFFRPAGHQQVDWTFPIDYKNLHFHATIPETKAMMDLIDEIQPEFIYSLHNAGFGGAYWYITHPMDPVYDDFRKVPVEQGVPLNLGEPEAPFCTALSPAVYDHLGIEDEYDYLEQYTSTDPGKAIKVGTCSAAYAKKKYDSYTILTELPYFYDKRIEDLSEGTMLRKEAMAGNLDFSEEKNVIIHKVMAAVTPFVAENNPFKLALEAFTDLGDFSEATRKMIETNPDFSKPATVAEEFDNLLVAKFYKLLSLGMLVRLCEDALAKPGITADEKTELEGQYAIADKEMTELSDYLEKEMDYQVVPVKNLVHIQLKCGFIAIEELRNMRA